MRVDNRTQTEKIYKFLGLSRRAGLAFIGQDEVFENIRYGEKILVILSKNVSGTVMKALKNAENSDKAELISTDADREELGKSVGVSSAQIIGIPYDCGIAEQILLIKRSVADE